MFIHEDMLYMLDSVFPKYLKRTTFKFSLKTIKHAFLDKKKTQPILDLTQKYYNVLRFPLLTCKRQLNYINTNRPKELYEYNRVFYFDDVLKHEFRNTVKFLCVNIQGKQKVQRAINVFRAKLDSRDNKALTIGIASHINIHIYSTLKPNE